MATCPNKKMQVWAEWGYFIIYCILPKQDVGIHVVSFQINLFYFLWDREQHRKFIYVIREAQKTFLLMIWHFNTWKFTSPFHFNSLKTSLLGMQILTLIYINSFLVTFWAKKDIFCLSDMWFTWYYCTNMYEPGKEDKFILSTLSIINLKNVYIL